MAADNRKMKTSKVQFRFFHLQMKQEEFKAPCCEANAMGQLAV
jgi:hypothetical protein